MAALPTFLSSSFGSKESRAQRFRFSTLFVLFSIELFALNIARLPDTMRFSGFAFCDHGSNLTLQFLISHNYRPGIDFGYLYGLLAALLGRVWFMTWGLTPWSYQFIIFALEIVCAWALANIYFGLGVGGFGLALTTIALGFAFQATYPNISHALEAALICIALAEQSRGNRAGALAVTVVAIFAKPSMAYVYSLVLILLMLPDVLRRPLNFQRWIAAFAPAAVTFLVTGAVLILEFGPTAVLYTCLPTQGRSIYRVMNFGILGLGRHLWKLDSPWPTYLLTHSGFWIASNLFLYYAGAVELAKAIAAGEVLNRKAELIVTCAILHLGFVLFFFGNQFSWIYYSYLLVIGSSLALDLHQSSRSFGVALCVVALLSWTALGYWNYRWWLTMAPSPSTKGLWASRDEREDWERIVSLTAGHKTVILHEMGAAELMFPGFQEPVSTYLMKGLMLPGDIARKQSQLSSTEMVVLPLTATECNGVAGLADDPAFVRSLEDFEPIWKGTNFELLQRRSE
jgi:hypothetical protein